MGVLDFSYIKALGVKSAGLKKIFLVFSGHPICKLACELEQTVGFCDWFIFSPHDYQSCKMFTKSLGDLENVLDGRCFKKVSNSFQ